MKTILHKMSRKWHAMHKQAKRLVIASVIIILLAAFATGAIHAGNGLAAVRLLDIPRQGIPTPELSAKIGDILLSAVVWTIAAISITVMWVTHAIMSYRRKKQKRGETN